MIAARVAADFQRESDVEVKTIKGGLGELSVEIDGKQIYAGNRFWYPTPTSVIKKARSQLMEKAE